MNTEYIKSLNENIPDFDLKYIIDWCLDIRNYLQDGYGLKQTIDWLLNLKQAVKGE